MRDSSGGGYVQWRAYSPSLPRESLAGKHSCTDRRIPREGSLGRRLVEGATAVSIYGERVPVRATINTLNGFSAHAGQSDLLKWLSLLAVTKPKVFITHGEDT